MHASIKLRIDLNLDTFGSSSGKPTGMVRHTGISFHWSSCHSRLTSLNGISLTKTLKNDGIRVSMYGQNQPQVLIPLKVGI